MPALFSDQSDLSLIHGRTHEHFSPMPTKAGAICCPKRARIRYDGLRSRADSKAVGAGKDRETIARLPRASTRALRSAGPAATSGTPKPRRSRIIARASRASSIPSAPPRLSTRRSTLYARRKGAPWPARSARRSRTSAGEPYQRAGPRAKGWTRTLYRLRHCNRYTHRARVLKDEFAYSGGLSYPSAVEKVLRLRMTSAPRSRFPRCARSSAR